MSCRASWWFGVRCFRQFDALSLLSLASSELEKAGIEVAAVQFVACGQPLDTAPMDADATLWVLNGDEGLSASTRGNDVEDQGDACRWPSSWHVLTGAVAVHSALSVPNHMPDFAPLTALVKSRGQPAETTFLRMRRDCPRGLQLPRHTLPLALNLC